MSNVVEGCASPAVAPTTIIVATTPTAHRRMSVHFMRARYHCITAASRNVVAELGHAVTGSSVRTGAVGSIDAAVLVRVGFCRRTVRPKADTTTIRTLEA